MEYTGIKVFDNRAKLPKRNGIEWTETFKFVLFRLNESRIGGRLTIIQMDTYQLELRDGRRVHVCRWGAGPDLLIALHGFGDQARFFARLAPAYVQRYTFVAFDLPFHGYTEWPAPAFNPGDVQVLVEAICRQQRVQRFSLLGFSFGARLALGIFPALAPRIDRLYVFAPAGRGMKGFDLADAAPVFIRLWCLRWVERPGFLIKFSRFLYRLGGLSRVSAQFLEKNLRRPERAKRAVCCWISLGAFPVRQKAIIRVLNQYPVAVEVHAGRHDPLIDRTKFENFYRNWPNTRVIWADQGHGIGD